VGLITAHDKADKEPREEKNFTQLNCEENKVRAMQKIPQVEGNERKMLELSFQEGLTREGKEQTRGQTQEYQHLKILLTSEEGRQYRIIKGKKEERQKNKGGRETDLYRGKVVANLISFEGCSDANVTLSGKE